MEYNFVFVESLINRIFIKVLIRICYIPYHMLQNLFILLLHIFRKKICHGFGELIYVSRGLKR